MSGKSKGTGLVDDEGKVVTEIEAFNQMVDRNAEKVISRASSSLAKGVVAGVAEIFKKNPSVMNNNCYTQTVDFTNYQNDGMGCPTLTKEQIKAQKWMERKNPLYDMIMELTKKPKRAKIRRVK